MPPRVSAVFVFSSARVAMLITKSRVLDRQTARVALNMLARDMSKGMVAELCETSISRRASPRCFSTWAAAQATVVDHSKRLATRGSAPTSATTC